MFPTLHQGCQKRWRSTQLAQRRRRRLHPRYDCVGRNQGRTTIEMALVENYGDPDVAIMDIADCRLLRADMRYLARKNAGHLWDRATSNPETEGLSQGDVDALPDLEDRHDSALAGYLDGEISLDRTAELPGMSWIELHVPSSTAIDRGAEPASTRWSQVRAHSGRSLRPACAMISLR